MAKDYYKILELNKNATNEEIKKAYKKLALKYHPDKNIENKKFCEEKFKDISEAYQIVGDKDKRYKYDNLGCDTELTPEDIINIFGLFKKPANVFSDVFETIPKEYQEVSHNIMNYFFENKEEFNEDLNSFNFTKIFRTIKKGIIDIPTRARARACQNTKGTQLEYYEIFSKVASIVYYIFYYCSFYFLNKFTKSQ